jgi:hypothetical protein
VYVVDDTPRTIAEAYGSSDADYWKETIKSEMDSIMSNGTWEVVSIIHMSVVGLQEEV